MSDHSEKGGQNPCRRFAIHGIDSIRIDAIPEVLKQRNTWVAWTAIDTGKAKPAKVPVDPATGANAKSNDSATWGTFAQAVERCKRDGLAGIGLMFSGDELVGVDLDNIWDHAASRFANPLAEAFVRSLDTYTEISPSGKGVKMWLRSTVPPAKCTGTIRQLGGTVEYETYNKGRWFACTGHVLPHYGSGEIQERTAKYLKMQELGAKKKAQILPGPSTHDAAPPLTKGAVADEEGMLRAALGFLDADTEPTWFRYGCCLKSWGATPGVGDARAKALWDHWSKTSSKFHPGEADAKWERLDSGRGLTIGTLFMEAEEEGYEYGDALSVDGAAYRVQRRDAWREALDWWIAGVPGDPDFVPKPLVELHGVGGWSRVTAIEAAAQLGGACSNCGELFVRNGTVVYVRGGGTVVAEPHDLAVVAARCARLVLRKETRGKDGPADRLVPTNATPGQCQDILAAREFRDSLPPLKLIAKCPVLVDDGRGGLRAARGYDRESGVLANGGDALDLPLEESKALILDALADFDFATPADRSRAIAAMFTPAMVLGGLLPGRAPIDLGEADDCQAGKGYRQKIVEAVYNDASAKVVQKHGGTGSPEETYSAALIGGACFISFDNVKGALDSPMIESSLTEDYCDARMPYGKPVQVDMRRVCVSMTSNDARLSRDLARRCSPVRIRRRPDDYAFRAYPEGDLLAHVRANQGRYLGAVFAVVKAWASAGRPMEADSGQHDFRGWARTMDWIVRRVFDAAPIHEGVRATQARMSNPNAGWAREVAILVARQGMLGRPLRAHQIVRLLEDCGAEIPGVEKGADLSDDANFRKANQAVGRRMASAFGKNSDVLEIDEMGIARQSAMDDGKEVHAYVFTSTKGAGNDGDNPRAPSGGTIGGRSGGDQAEAAVVGVLARLQGDHTGNAPPDEAKLPPDAPPNVPPEKPHVPPIPPDGVDTFLNTRIINTTGQCSEECISVAGKSDDFQADQAEISTHGKPEGKTSAPLFGVDLVWGEDGRLRPGTPEELAAWHAAMSRYFVRPSVPIPYVDDGFLSEPADADEAIVRPCGVAGTKPSEPLALMAGEVLPLSDSADADVESWAGVGAWTGTGKEQT